MWEEEREEVERFPGRKKEGGLSYLMSNAVDSLTWTTCRAAVHRTE
jgi:hypothetical protein